MAGNRLGALERGGGGLPPRHFQCISAVGANPPDQTPGHGKRIFLLGALCKAPFVLGITTIQKPSFLPQSRQGLTGMCDAAPPVHRLRLICCQRNFARVYFRKPGRTLRHMNFLLKNPRLLAGEWESVNASPAQWLMPLVSPPPPQSPPVKQGKSEGSVGTPSQGKGKGSREGKLGQGGRGRAPGGERPRGTTADGGKGSQGRAVNGDPPSGAAGCRPKHTKASYPPPPPPPVWGHHWHSLPGERKGE